MGSPRRARRDQEKRGDIKERLQALAKSSTNNVKKSSNNSGGKLNSKSQNSYSASKDRHKNDANSGNRKGIEQIMERARSEGGNRWTKKLLDEEARNPERWGHSGFKELYKSELGINSRRSRSRERAKNRRSRSREPTRGYGMRERRRESRSSTDLRRKRSLSSSDASVDGRKSKGDSGKRVSKGSSNDRNAQSLKSLTRAPDTRSNRQDNTKKRNDEERKRDIVLKKDRLKKTNISRSKSRSRSPIRSSDKTTSKKTVEVGKRHPSRRGPVSPPAHKYSRSRSSSRSSDARVRHRPSLSGNESSHSSSSPSSMSRSSSSSSSSERSSSSGSSPSPENRSDLKRRLTSKGKYDNPRYVDDMQKSKQGHIKTVKKLQNDNKVKETGGKKWRERSVSPTSSASSSNSEDDDVEEGEEDSIDGDEELPKDSKAGNPAQRISLSERFGKLAQLSSQRRNLELVQLRIVAPVGGNGTSEKNVSVDETSAAPIISHKPSLERPIEQKLTANDHHHHQHAEHHHHQHHHYKNVHHHDEQLLPDDRAREDRWRDWHDRYDHYRHVQPPRQLPRDWDDIRVRHKYYTDRGYFGHDMTLDELSRWEAWWHQYQQWRRGYEHAWIKTHGPHVPVEYPDWSHYRSTSIRAEAPIPVNSTSSSIRSRLGWRR